MSPDSSPDGLMQTGLAFYHGGNFAAAAFRTMLDRETCNIAARSTLPMLYNRKAFRARRGTKAGAAAMPALAEAWIILGAIRLNRGMPQEFVQAYAEACRLKPNAVAAQAGLAAAAHLGPDNRRRHWMPPQQL